MIFPAFIEAYSGLRDKVHRELQAHELAEAAAAQRKRKEVPRPGGGV